MELIYETDNQADSHKKLEEVLVDHPLAECRIDYSTDKPYQVWSEPDPRSRGND